MNAVRGIDKRAQQLELGGGEMDVVAIWGPKMAGRQIEGPARELCDFCFIRVSLPVPPN